MMEFHFEKAPAVSWEQAIASRIARSAVVGCAKTRSVIATLFYDDADREFSLRVHVLASKQDELHSCELREQHGGMALVFMQMNLGGFPMATGHAYLKGNLLLARLRTGYEFTFQVDPHAPHFVPLVVRRRRGPTLSTWRPASRPAFQVVPQRAMGSDDADDLSEMDLKRLRGEIAIHESQAMRDSRNSERRWRT